ncbi:MAG: restriction endonuclease [Hyphomicrobiales bacterium]
MIPDYQSLMRPVLECAEPNEVSVADVVTKLADKLNLSEVERNQLLPSGKQTTFSNRVQWARSYLKMAGLVKNPRRGFFEITDRGKEALAQSDLEINNAFLSQFEEFQAFQKRGKGPGGNNDQLPSDTTIKEVTPDEILRNAHAEINRALANELLTKIREANPAFFEQLIIDLLISMGYGGTSYNAGQALGKSGDDGIDGVIDQDPLGVDQIYLQAKRYAHGNNVGSGAMRDFFGALSLKKATKGIFVTTSKFSTSAIQTANDLGTRIVLIDGEQLSKLMIRYSIGCQSEEVLHLKKLDDGYFEAE